MNSSQKAINSACRMLGIREHSEKQIRTKLKKKGFDNKEIEESVEFLIQNSWLSNQRFCGAFIRSRVSRGQGKARIEYELLQNEITPNLIDEAFEGENVNWQAECEQVLAKKVLTFFGDNKFGVEGFLDNDQKVMNRKLELANKSKIDRFMKYRGFEPSQIAKAYSKMKIRIG